MRPLSASDLLCAWERGLTYEISQTGLIFLSFASPVIPIEELAKLSIGDRDGLLLDLREEIFGTEIEGIARCPQCGELAEVLFHTFDVRAKSRETCPLSLTASGFEIKFRLPNSIDLEAIISCKGATDARDAIFRRCVEEVIYEGKISKEELPASIAELVIDAMAKADLQGDILLKINCASCHHEWDLSFDIVSFFWKEVDSWAHRILLAVHTLASAYGWREEEILNMSPLRRQLYLEMIRG